MSKTPITWLELIKLKLGEEKGKSLNDVMPAAKKEWVQIKEGKHPKYTQGKAQTHARKKKSGDSSTRKASKNSSSSSGKNSSSSSSSRGSSIDIQAILDQVKLCSKCKKKVEKILKKKEMKGGFSPFYDEAPPNPDIIGAGTSGPTFEPMSSQSSLSAAQYGGGKKRKGGKKTQKKQKGGNGGGCAPCMRGGGVGSDAGGVFKSTPAAV